MIRLMHYAVADDVSRRILINDHFVISLGLRYDI
jgi:hypothetical protein